MCDPISGAAIAMQAGGMAMQAGRQRAIGRANAATARFEADQTREIGRFNESRARDRMTRLIAQQRGQLAARGVNLSSTSAQRLGAEAGAEMATEAAAQRFNTDSRATALTNEGRLHQSSAQMNFLTGVTGAGATALTNTLNLWPELVGT